MTGAAIIAETKGPAVRLTSRTVTDTNTAGLSDSNTYELNLSGLVRQVATVAGTVTLETWINEAAQSGLYEAMVTVTSGSLTSGTTGSWLNLGTTRQWNVTNPGPGAGTVSCTFTVQIRIAATAVVVATASIVLNAVLV